MSKKKWEQVTKEEAKVKGKGLITVCERLKVHGGWLVRNGTAVVDPGFIDYTITTSSNICFVPDQNHEWVVDE